MAFKPGQSGNPKGRPKGSRDKLNEDFFKVLAEDFAQNGADVIRTLRQNDPATYSRIVASIMPKENKVDVTHHEGESVNEAQAKAMAVEFLSRAARTESVGEK